MGAFSSTFAEKYALEKQVFFRSLPGVFFFRFLTLWGSFGGALWRGFCANIDCSQENATSQKPWFYLGISIVLTVAAGPRSIQGAKNTHAEAMPVLGSRNNSAAQFSVLFFGAAGSHFSCFAKMCFF